MGKRTADVRSLGLSLPGSSARLNRNARVGWGSRGHRVCAEVLQGCAALLAHGWSPCECGGKEGSPGENLSPLPCIFSGQELEHPSVYPAECHGQEAKPCWAFPSGGCDWSAGEQTSGVCFHNTPPVQRTETHIQPSIPRLQRGPSTSSSTAPKCPCKSSPFIPRTFS